MLPGGPLIPIATALAIVWLFYSTVTLREIIALGIVVLIALALYGVRLLRRRKLPAEPVRS